MGAIALIAPMQRTRKKTVNHKLKNIKAIEPFKSSELRLNLLTSKGVVGSMTCSNDREKATLNPSTRCTQASANQLLFGLYVDIAQYQLRVALGNRL